MYVLLVYVLMIFAIKNAYKCACIFCTFKYVFIHMYVDICMHIDVRRYMYVCCSILQARSFEI